MVSLNQMQEVAVNSSHPRILCLAGAGTGKTRTLTSRIARLYHDGVKIDNMLALTFTRAAGHEMKERIIEMIGDDGKDLFCNTFHAFCAKLVRRYAYKVGYTPAFTIYDDEDRTAMLEQIIEDYGYKLKVKDVLRDISNNTLYGTSIKDADTRAVWREYIFRIRKNNAIDLDGLLTHAARILMDATVQAAIREQYTHVFIDEFQDTDHRQLQILNLVAADNMFIVGDDFQSIYQFRGADVSIIMNLAEDPDYEVVKLEDNYRSTINIVDAANTLIKHNNQTEKVLKSHREGDNIMLIESEDNDGELESIVKIINAEFVWNRYDDIAIIGRTNKQIEDIYDYLKTDGIPCTIKSRKTDVLRGNDAKKLFAWMNAIVNKRDDKSVEIAMNYPMEHARKSERQKAEMFALEKDCSLYTALQATGVASGFLNMYYDIEQRISADYDADEAVSALDMFEYITAALTIRELYLGTGLRNRASDIDRIQEEIRLWQAKQVETGDGITTDDWLEYYRMILVDGELRVEEEEDAVQIMTAHGSKGLEFDTVIIAGCNNGTFPLSKGELEEERRLFYVAMTRAKNRLILTRAKDAVLYDFHTIEKERSMFISEMERYI